MKKPIILGIIILVFSSILGVLYYIEQNKVWNEDTQKLACILTLWKWESTTFWDCDKNVQENKDGNIFFAWPARSCPEIFVCIR